MWCIIGAFSLQYESNVKESYEIIRNLPFYPFSQLFHGLCLLVASPKVVQNTLCLFGAQNRWCLKHPGSQANFKLIVLQPIQSKTACVDTDSETHYFPVILCRIEKRLVANKTERFLPFKYLWDPFHGSNIFGAQTCSSVSEEKIRTAKKANVSLCKFTIHSVASLLSTPS